MRRPGGKTATPGARPPIAALLVVSFLSLSAAVGVHARLTAHAFDRDEAERIDRIPPVAMLEALPPLQRRMAADILWIRVIQSYGYHRQTDGDFTAMHGHFDALTRVDPTFEQAYAFGGLALADDGEDPEAGIELLKRGMEYMPHRWRLPFEVGFIYYMHYGDVPRAAHYFDLASTLPDAPEYVQHFAAFAYLRAGHRQMARAFWMALYEETTSEAVRRLAAEALQRLDREEERLRMGDQLSEGASGGGKTDPGRRAHAIAVAITTGGT